MYNLFVSGHESAWEGDPWTIRGKEGSRWLKEYTDDELTREYRGTDRSIVSALRRFPCIFAYENGLNKDPLFGIVKNISPLGAGVTVVYETVAIDRFLTYEELEWLSPLLDITGVELYRTHWALKQIDLPKVLAPSGIVLPPWAGRTKQLVDIEEHNFEVALSFPGGVRELVYEVSVELERLRGPDTYFYDNNYKSQIAQPNADTLLQAIYQNRSDLVVVFLSGEYQLKNWCGLEFRAIRERIFKKEGRRVMFIRTDKGEVEGVYETDGYIDAETHTAREIAELISERVELAQVNPRN